jgi:UDP-N-acetylmuramoyl-tripeptide--D-alanyl-D-alanine ligase
MIKAIFSLYRPRYVTTLVYMLQNSDYHIDSYIAWYWRTQNFNHVMYRRKLDRTKVAQMLTLFLSLGMILQVFIGLWLIGQWEWHSFTGGLYFGLALILSYPVVWAHLVTLPLIVGRVLIIDPKQKQQIIASEKIFKRHKAAKLAIAGSYGKTSMKEILQVVLSEGKKVAATPANKNVPSSHAQFAMGLGKDEDILIIEYGEGAPGDVAVFAATTHPTHGIITGIAPAHLDRYKTIEAVTKDIFSLAEYLKDNRVYVNGESPLVTSSIKSDYFVYNSEGALDWNVSDIKLDFEGTSFVLKKGKRSLKLHTKLLGRHHLGPLSLAVGLADDFGLSTEQIKKGVENTQPFEHRMQPYQMSGAWIIDDTYNGNIEGIRAGTNLLAELKAKRRLYVTPGLVDQGKETKDVHIEMGKLIANAEPDVVVLMKNSVTEFIHLGLKQAKFKGELLIEHHPLEFYKNLGEFVAAGDVVMLQNDWPDNYN